MKMETLSSAVSCDGSALKIGQVNNKLKCYRKKYILMQITFWDQNPFTAS